MVCVKFERDQKSLVFLPDVITLHFFFPFPIVASPLATPAVTLFDSSLHLNSQAPVSYNMNSGKGKSEWVRINKKIESKLRKIDKE